MTNPTAPSRGADILPFPTQSKPEAPEERLRRALITLDRAVAAQRAAVTDWQAAIGSLRQSMDGLGASVNTYHGTLGALSGKVVGLGEAARQLQAQAGPGEADQRR